MDSLITALISDVRQCPDDVVEDLLRVGLVNDLSKRRDATHNFVEIWSWLSLAEVGKSPDCVAHK